MCKNEQFSKDDPIIITNSAYGEGNDALVESNCWAHFLQNLYFLNWREIQCGRQPTYGLIDAKTREPINPREIIRPEIPYSESAKFLRDNLYFESSSEWEPTGEQCWEAWTITDPVFGHKSYLGAAVFPADANADQIEWHFKEQNPDL